MQTAKGQHSQRSFAKEPYSKGVLCKAAKASHPIAETLS